MRSIYCIALFLFTSNFLYAQDTLFMEDGIKLIVKVLEVNESVIRYKLSTDLDGPIHVITIEDVKKLVYSSGSMAVFNQGAANVETAANGSPKKRTKTIVQVPPKPPQPIYIGKNFISINLLHLLTGSLTIGYEHTLASGNNSVKCPISFGYHSPGFPDYVSKEDYDRSDHPYDGNYFSYKIFSFGLDYYKYPHKKGKAKYFYGPSIEYGQFNFWNQPGNPDPPDYSDYVKDEAAYYVVLFQNGFLYHPTSHFALSITAGIGYFQAGSKDYNQGYNGNLVLKGGLNVGYNF